MLDGQYFTKLEEIARAVRSCSLPFGGIQLVVCGDFFQLPPVSKGKSTEQQLCFETDAWNRCLGKKKTVLLSRVYRQTDQTFLNILDEIRWGECSEDSASTLRQAGADAKTEDSDIVATMLLTRKKDVDAINSSRLDQLEGTAELYSARDSGVSPASAQMLAASCSARQRLHLKVGAQVILLRNISVQQGLCNGSRGVVTKIKANTRYPEVRFANGLVRVISPETWKITIGGVVAASREQIPLELAWAMSVHKSQGMTLDKAVVDLSSVFEYGQAYVALSRVKSLRGLALQGFNRSKVRAHPRVKAFYTDLQRDDGNDDDSQDDERSSSEDDDERAGDRLVRVPDFNAQSDDDGP
eukprot:CAMPEP_0175123576 /NCGR_PEP_ID=MMETSP0087-20121206/2320_1 /TAXON_ID=136419 /ORGANISM="Unknown Unknown, Strain D1" /LENGTH=354 /DNA_ID=CAMNT_0016405283 /DNA_START=291 /DNA_END=1355 /DNA_ORIENTATION=+